MGEPALELGGLVRDEAHSHQGVRRAAELGALAEILTGLQGGEDDVVHASRNDVALATHLGNPERVQHVVGPEAEMDRLADGNVDLVRRHYGVAVREWVAKL